MANISSLTAPIGQAPYSPLSDVRLSDEVIDQLVVEIGAGHVLCALDRLMSPKLPLRAAE